jgi:hypothetical protein
MTGSMASEWNGRMGVCYWFIGLERSFYSDGRSIPIERNRHCEDRQPWVNRYWTM